MGVFRTSAARVLRPQFDYVPVIYDPVIIGPLGARAVFDDPIDGGLEWATIDGILSPDSAEAVTSGGTATYVSQSLVLTLFPFNIDPSRSIAGIKVELLGAHTHASFPGPFNLTVRLVKNGVTRPSFRRQPILDTTPTDYIFGGSLDSWDEPWTPGEINTGWGVSLRQETPAPPSWYMGVQYVRATIYTTDSVLPVLTYAAGTYTFGPTAIPVDKTSASFYIDTALHTVANVTITTNIEISFDSGSSWQGLVGGARTGEAASTHPSGQPNERAWMTRALEQPENPDRQFKGAMVVSGGGSIYTSLGAYFA